MHVTRPALPTRYATPEPIASGGMGEVYRATDSMLGRTVAIKVLSGRWAGHDEFNARFLREARTAANLSGEPHVISIYDVSETADGLPFIVMEYARRGTVGDRLERGALPSEQALRWLEQAGRALDRAHARGVVHRDVKPANLLIADDETIRVSDFGIARAADQDTLTEVGSVLGSAGYMAPEQARGEPTSPASDRYALACVAFECLTGRRPFARESQAAEAAAHAHEPPPSIRRLDPSLPAALEAVFMRGLAKAADERYPTCASFVSDLRAALGTAPSSAATIVARPAVVNVHRSARFGRRGRGVLVAAGALGLLAAGGVAALALGGGGEPESATVVLTQTVEGRERTVVVTETTEGATVERTVTTEGSQAVGKPPSSANAGESGTALNDRGFRLLQAGDPRAALPLLESAVAKLQGTSSITEAYASYNLAVARFANGTCDSVAQLLDRSEEIQGRRMEIDRLRKQVEKRCRD